jgi:chemotaxis protein CheX
MSVHVTEPDLADIVEGATSTMLGIDLGALAPSGTTPNGDSSVCAVGASVQFTGEWSGALVIGCDELLGNEAAAAMFGCDTDNVAADDLSDALGELANMIAGNVKPLLPGAIAISLPTVVQGSELRLGIPGAAPTVGVTYRRGACMFSVEIYERSQGPRTHS